MASKEETLKSYYGNAPTKDRPAWVTTRDTRGPKVLTHHVRHSPTGFNWGYGGSGPGELARCLLLDAFGTDSCPSAPDNECQCENKWAETAYPAFRDAVVANLTQDEDWKFQQGWIVDWVFDYLAVADEITVGELLAQA